MDFDSCTAQLADNAQRIRTMVEHVSDQQARWKPDQTSWSILEVAGHLLDEEREDFRVRLDITLHRADEAWPGIDPEGWVTKRRYNEQDPAQVLGNFLREREASLTWLRELAEPDWEATYAAPWGPIRAGDLLAAWVAHDLLHLRQLVELQWSYTGELVAPYSTRYAGAW